MVVYVCIVTKGALNSPFVTLYIDTTTNTYQFAREEKKTMNENRDMNCSVNQKGIFVPDWVLDFVERCKEYMDFETFGRTLMGLTASMREAAGVHYYDEDD